MCVIMLSVKVANSSEAKRINPREFENEGPMRKVELWRRPKAPPEKVTAASEGLTKVQLETLLAPLKRATPERMETKVEFVSARAERVEMQEGLEGEETLAKTQPEMTAESTSSTLTAGQP